MIYLDHNSTTKMDERVPSKMMPYFRENFANPSSTYRIAQEAKEALEDARETVANCLKCDPKEIYFTLMSSLQWVLNQKLLMAHCDSVSAGKILKRTSIKFLTFFPGS